MSTPLIRQLQTLNRKERYWVVNAATQCGFEISDEFASHLKNNGIPISQHIDKSEVFVAMDYHLDWIYASLFLSHQRPGSKGPFINDIGLIKGNQEDIDLIVAFPDADNRLITHLVMIEAKGETPWSSAQARSKGARLSAIFEPNWPKVIPHYRIWSPRPTRLKSDSFPPWAKNENGQLHWLPLHMNVDLQKITRCTQDCEENRRGRFWMLE